MMNVGCSSRTIDAAVASSCWACQYREQIIRCESGGSGETDTKESSREGGGGGFLRGLDSCCGRKIRSGIEHQKATTPLPFLQIAGIGVLGLSALKKKQSCKFLNI